MDRPAAVRSGSLIGKSNNNDNNNQHLKTIHNQANTKELLSFVERSQKETIELRPYWHSD